MPVEPFASVRTSELPRIAGLDIGGANIKAWSEAGVVHRPFALWRRPDDLPGELRATLEALGPVEVLRVTMTGELCDVFACRRDGVERILDALRVALETAPGIRAEVWTTSRELLTLDGAARAWERVAAANWLALADAAARLVDGASGVLIDVGSTTTDIIALRGGVALPNGLTDVDRLATGELVYTGVGRTPLCAVLSRCLVRGRWMRTASELFATTRDVWITLGRLPEEPQERDTADGRPATRRASLSRLARMVCDEPPSFSEADAWGLASAAADAQRESIRAAIADVVESSGLAAPIAVVSGTGEFLARDVATGMGIRRVVSLSEAVGEAASRAACAWALAHR